MNKSIEERLEIIENRNKRVEQDKAWETSVTRRVLIATITYALVGIYLSWLNVEKPWLNAVVPVVAFAISTLAIHEIKKIWIDKHK